MGVSTLRNGRETLASSGSHCSAASLQKTPVSEQIRLAARDALQPFIASGNLCNTCAAIGGQEKAPIPIYWRNHRKVLWPLAIAFIVVPELN
jgi:hypothetical protein